MNEKEFHVFSIYNKNFYYDINYGNLYDVSSNVSPHCNKQIIGKKNNKNKFLIDHAELTDKNFPITSIALHVSNDCNLRCTYCFGDGGSYGQNRDYMSEETAKKAIDMLIESCGDSKVLIVTFFGGEPLMNFKLMKKVVEYCKEKEEKIDKKFKYTMTTNGTLLNNEEILNFIKEKNISTTVSIDGNKETHDKYRIYPDGSGSFDQMMIGVKKLLNKSDQVGGRITLGDDALNMNQILNEVSEIGFKKVVVALASGSEDNSSAIKENSMKSIYSEYEKTANDYINTLKAGDIYTNSTLFNNDIKKIHQKKPAYFFCGVGKKYVSIMPDEKIYTCHRFAGNRKYIMGDINEGIDKEKHQNMINLHVDNKDKCKECWARYLCGGGCHYNSEIIGSKNRENSEVNCDLTRKYYELCLFIYYEMQKNNPNYWDEEFAREKWRKKLGLI